jgi:hypothetical protein
MKRKNRQTGKDMFLTAGGQKREKKEKRIHKTAKKMLFIFCEQTPIFNV